MNNWIRWGIEDATASAGPPRTRRGCWHFFFSGLILGVAVGACLVAAAVQ